MSKDDDDAQGRISNIFFHSHYVSALRVYQERWQIASPWTFDSGPMRHPKGGLKMICQLLAAWLVAKAVSDKNCQ